MESGYSLVSHIFIRLLNVSENPYAKAGVDTAAGDIAVELMKAEVAKTHGSQVLGGYGGFAGLFDAEFLTSYRHPVLATSTDGVGTKIAIAIAIDKHDTIGQDLVGMTVDDIAVAGAKPLFMTDYIATGRVIPERVAEIVGGIARALHPTGAALIGGETAEHPGLLGADEYDIAAAVTGVMEKDSIKGAHLVETGDVVLAVASSGLHSNGFSLVRKIVADAGLDYRKHSDDFSGVLGEVLLEPTMIYSALLNSLFDSELGKRIHSISHITGGGIAANIARIMPVGSSLEIDRSLWQVPDVFTALAGIAGISLPSLEETWNLGIGIALIVDAGSATEISSRINTAGFTTWELGKIGELDTTRAKGSENAEWTIGGKGASGGAVRLLGAYRN